METIFLTNRIAISILAICLLAVLLVPFVTPLFVSKSAPQEATVNPTISKIQKELEAKKPWHKLHDRASQLLKSIQQPSSDTTLVSTFTQKTLSENNFVVWIKKNKPSSIQSMKKNQRGFELWQSYRTALIKSHLVHKRRTAIVQAPATLKKVIQQVRGELVAPSQNESSLTQLQEQFEQLQQSVSEPSSDSIETVDDLIGAEVDREIQETFLNN